MRIILNQMISVTEAIEIIRNNTTLLKPIKLPLTNAAGKMLAEDIFSSIDSPSFLQSSMDGYTFCFDDWKKNKTLILDGVIED